MYIYHCRLLVNMQFQRLAGTLLSQGGRTETER